MIARHSYTTQEQKQILELLSEGYNLKEISKELNRSEQSLKNQLRAMRAQRNAWNTIHMVSQYIKDQVEEKGECPTLKLT